MGGFIFMGIMEEKLFELEEIIGINTYERGLNIYNIVDIDKSGVEKQHTIELSKVDIDSGVIMFIDFNDEIIKCFLTESIEIITITYNPELYKLIFKDGRQTFIFPVK
ncbi:MAG: hypothetical protein K0S18_112 [Anaerocolumna sp.]|jgi:hypothetical protein|nr:hypothetical protein [Anaerocolumna sp.]